MNEPTNLIDQYVPLAPTTYYLAPRCYGRHSTDGCDKIANLCPVRSQCIIGVKTVPMMRTWGRNHA